MCSRKELFILLQPFREHASHRGSQAFEPFAFQFDVYIVGQDRFDLRPAHLRIEFLDSFADLLPVHFAPQEPLFFLDRLDIVAKICDALVNCRFVVVFDVLKDGAPHGHFGRTMSREARAKPKDAHNVVIRKFAEVALGEGSEVRHPPSQCRRGRAAAFTIRPVTSRAVLFEHRSARRHVGGREL